MVAKFIPKIRDKRRLTEELINLLPIEQRPTVDTALPIWWHNLRKTGGLRLTDQGCNLLVNQLDVKYYDFNIDDPTEFTQHTILDLDRKMQMPYYIHVVKGIPKKIILFGSQEAVVVHLYGNLQQFLDNYDP